MWLAVEWAMDDLPVKHPCPFNQKTLDFYLRLLILLKNVIHNQSVMPHCPPRTADGGFPSFTSEAGSPFFFQLPLRAIPGHMQHYQLSLGEGDSSLPHWMMFRRQSRTLAGLALTEDCGRYHLEVSVTGEKCAAHFYLHILNKTVTDKHPARDTLSCSGGEMMMWANLLLQLNPATLDASGRLRLVATMADYLHLPMGFVSLFSRRKSFLQQQKQLRVCSQDRLAEKPDVSGDAAELLWPVGCKGEEQQSDLARVLEHSVKAGGLARLLEAPVLEWKLLCVVGGVRRKVKRDLQRPKFTPTPNVIVPPPTLVQETVKLDLSHTYSYIPLKLETSLSTISLLESPEKTRLEQTPTDDSDDSEDSNHMQKIQVTATALSFKQTIFHPFNKDGNTVMQQQVFARKTSLISLYRSVSVGFICSRPRWVSMQNSQQHIKQTGLSASKIKPLVEATGCSGKVSEVTSDVSSHISEHFCTTELFSSPFLPGHTLTVRHFVGDPTLLPSSTLHSIYPSLPLTPASYSVTSTLTHEAVDGGSHATRLTPRPHLKETTLQREYYRANRTDSESQPTVSSQGHNIFNQEPTKDHNSAKPTLCIFPSVSHPPLTESYNDVLPLNSRLKPIQSLPSSNKIQITQLFPDVSPTSYLMTEQLSITPQNETIQHLSPAPSGMNQDVTSQLNVTTQDLSSTTLMGQLTLSGQTELESSLSTSLLEPSVTMFTPALPPKLSLFSGQHETLSTTNPVFLKASSSLMSLLQMFSRSLLPNNGVSSLQQNVESKVVVDSKSKSGTEVSFDRNGQTQTLISGISQLLVQMSLSTKIPEIISVPLTMLKDQSFEEQLSVKSAHGTMSFMPSMQQTLIRTLQLEVSEQTDHSSNIFLVPGMTTSMYLNTTLLTTVKLGLTVTNPVLLSISKSTGPVSEGHFEPTAPSTAQGPYITSSIHLIQSLEPSLPGQSVAKDHVYVSWCTTPIKSTHLKNTMAFSSDEKHWTSFPSHFLMFDSSGQFFSTQTLVDCLSLDPTSLPSAGRFSIITYTSLQAVGLSSDTRQSSVQPSSSSASVSDSLNLPPKVLQSIPLLMATVGFPFHYSIPPKTFLDPEDGETDVLSLEIRLIDRPPLSVGTWLALDGLELHGVPLEVDLRFTPQHLLLVARDRRGLSASLPLTLDLRRSPVKPCHIFTLTAQRSLHSILRHRRMVELFLRKLSRFFNSSGGHHLSVVSMMPGSTVVSWYNCSLCEMGQIKTTHCHVDQIQSMWSAMRFADGSVNLEFREAMLPEFPITKVGPVSYRHDCFSTTPTPTFGTSKPTVDTTMNTSLSPTSNTCLSASTSITPTSQQINSYQWMAGVFTALLVVCLLILIVLLVATVLYFCRGRGRSRTGAIWPANRPLSVQSEDLRAIRPRRPPLFQPELPPPPLRLWINLTQDDERPLPLYYEQGRKTLDKALKPRPPHYDF